MTYQQNSNLFDDLEFTNLLKQQEEDFSSIKWSQESLPLWKFVEKYTLPQIVRIENGHYSQEEESSLSSGQIMKIHCLKNSKKVAGIDQQGNDIYIPLNSDKKLLLRPDNWFQIFDTVDELAQGKPTPRFVEVTRGYYDDTAMTDNDTDYTVEPGERLEVLKDTEKLPFSKKKSMTFKNQHGLILKLPYDCAAMFTPLLDLEELLLTDALQAHNLPIYASISECGREATGENSDHFKKTSSRYGVIQLQKIFEEELIVASCGHQNVRVIFTIPKQINVTVKTAAGTLTNDPVYSSLCHNYNNYQNIEALVIQRHEKDIYMTCEEARGYEYFLKSIESGNFEGMEEEDTKDEQNFPENHENMSNETFGPSIGTSGEEENLTVHIKKESLNANNEGLPEKTDSSHLKLSNRKVLDHPSESVTLVAIKKLDDKAHNVDMFQTSPGFLPGFDNSTATFSNEEEEYPVDINVPQVTKKDSITVHGTESTSVIVSPSNDASSNINNNYAETYFPYEIQPLSMEQICQCLQKLNLQHLERVFRENQINGELLVSLELDDLKDLSLTNFEAKKLLKFVNGWRPDQS